MGDRHDYVALEWVKGEIAETLKQARQALEAFVENTQDATRMRFCLAHVHQVYGTLQMVEFYGAALLAEEMEQLTQALLDERVNNQSEALEVLMQAILQLPVYLDRVQEARRDLPMVVLPLLNDLRAARGEKLLSETSLFSPDLSTRPGVLDADALAKLDSAEWPGLLRKLRQTLQLALVGVIRNQDLPTNLGYMARVFARLEGLCQESPLAPLWQIAAGVVEGLTDGSVSNGSSVRTLLRQVDKELKRLLEEGSAGVNHAAPEDLVKNLLFYLAKASSTSPRIAALKARYRLDEALPDSGVVDAERARLAGPDRDAMRSVVAALCEELVRVKDSLDLFVRSDRLQVAELASLLAPLKQIADTLAVLGFGQPRKVILDQLDALQAMAGGQREPSDALLMDVAGALLYVEATLAGMAGPSEEARSEQNVLPTTDVAQIHQVVIKEARNGLEQAKDGIIEFIASQWNHEHLQRVPELLTQVRGGLAMIPLPRAAALLDAASHYIQEQLLVRRMVPSWQSLDTLADAISGVEYYLERIAEDNGLQGEQILDLAEESLASLGYPLQAKPSILDQVEQPLAESPASVAEPAELAASEADAAAPAELSLPPAELLVSDDNWSLAEAPLENGFEGIDLALDAPVDLSAEWDAASLPVDAGLDSSLAPLPELTAEWDAELTESLEPESLAQPISVELPETQPAEQALSMADVMAAPVAAINPPAREVPVSLLPPPADEEPVDEDLQEVFIEEAGEVLETIAEFLPQWFANTEDKQALGEVRRAFHTLKGSGRMVRALVIGELSWSIENMLNRVLDRSIEPGDAVRQVIQDVVELLPALVEEFAAKAQRQRDDVDQLAAMAHALARGQQLSAQAPAEVLPEPAAAMLVEPPALQEESADELDPQLLEIFRNEAEGHLETLNAFLADCERELPQPITDDLQRALHTLKGSAYMAGILPIAEMAAPLEKLTKEFKANQIDIDMVEAALLRDAVGLFQHGLDQLDSTPLRPVEGAAQLVERIHQLHGERLQQGQVSQPSEAPASCDPSLLNLFLAQGMDILLDAEDLLQRWREHPAEQQELNALLEELHGLERGARAAELPQIELLCQALLEIYAAVQDCHLEVGPIFFEEAERAHAGLLDMMDQLAAGLQVEPQPERVEALRALLNHVLCQGSAALAVREAPIELAGEPAEPMPQEPLAVAEVAVPPVRSEAVEPAPLMAGLDDEMVDIFLEEAVDVLESAGQALERWLADPDSRQMLSALQRDLHTLKGGARMAEISPIGDLAHELESLYEGLIDRRFQPSQQLAELLQESHDLLAVQLEQLQGRRPLGSPAELIEAIRSFRLGPVVAQLPEVEEIPAAPSLAQDESAQQEQHEATAAAPLPADELPQLPVAELSEIPDQLPEPEPEPEIEVELPEPAQPEPQGQAQSLTELPQLPAAEAPLAAFDERDPELVEIFLEEGFDIIESAGASLQRWIADVDNSLELASLQRDLHTLKGGARMAEISEIGDLAHELEFLYEGLGNGQLRASEQLFGLLHACHDRLADMLEAVRDKRALPQGQSLIDAMRRLRANPDEQLSVPEVVHLQPVVEASTEGESEILDIFLEEAEELLEDLETAIGRWEAKREDEAPVADILRSLHTLKGGARLAEQRRLGDLAHDFEQYLTELKQGADRPESLFVDVQSAFEGLQQEIEQLRERLGASLQEEATSAPRELPASAPGFKLNAPIVAASPQQAPAQQTAEVLPFVRRAVEAAEQAAARRAPQELVKVPAELLEGLVNLAGETSIFRGRVEQQVSDVGFTLGEMEATIERVRDQLRRLDTETQAQILSRYQAEAERSGYEDFDPLEMDRHSQLQQLSRALFESASDLLELKEALAAKNRDAETLLLQQARVNSELQEGLMRTRMVPFDRLVPRLRRIVRQVAGELGKQVEFVVGNAEGEMDRTVLERIVAPLEHMLRNAVDHGIEAGEVRRAAGKPEQGTIRLSLGREGGDILLTLADDGGGIKLEAVRRKAIERGLMDADANLSDYEVLQFILEPGFSTAEKVTQISGRGVGMDVVHSEVKQLGGSMSIESTVGQGTRFLIRLPFTVSVNRALMVLSGEDIYAIPLNTIEGIVRVSPFELEALYEQAGSGQTPRFEYAGQTYELKYLGDLLNNGQHPKLVGQSLPLPVILVRSSEHAMAVQVDSLGGSREIVVKSLGRQFAGVHGISGATILGDGRVVVILDLMATIRAMHAHVGQSLPVRAAGKALPVAEGELERPPLVMVVDDSVTVRKVTTRLLERAGMNAITAKDGVDAIAQLQEQRPDIMLLDVEMPRMDGFEVAALVRHDERLKDLPIIMITSRTGEKHRQRAMAIGVNEYLGKPYQESLLLETINRLVKRND